MTEPPRRLAPSPEERLKVNLDRMAPGSAVGQTRSARPVVPDTRPASRAIAGSINQVQTDPVVIGSNASASGITQIALGEGAETSADYAIAIGTGSEAFDIGAIALGGTASATGEDSVAAGTGSQSAGFRAVAIGYNAEAPNDNDFVLGIGTHAVQIPGTFALTSGGATPVGPQTTPVTLADVIAILQAFGFAL